MNFAHIISSSSYEVMFLPKKSGGVRKIYVPKGDYKRWLQKMVGRLNSIQSQLCPYAYAFVPGRCAGVAARLHAPHAVTICWDLRDWFDSVTADQINLNLGGRLNIRDCLIDGAPRQGLPTSPALANIAAADLDRQIVEYLGGLGVYTRYADDLSISVDDPDLVEHLLRDIPLIVEKYGWEIHPKKTQVQWAHRGRRVICGVAVDTSGAYATRSARRRLRAAEHQARLDVRGATDSARGLREWCAQRLPLISVLSSRIGGRQPSAALLESLDLISRKNRLNKRFVVENFDAKSYLRAYKWLIAQKTSNQDRDLHRWAVALSCVFGSSWQSWIDGCTRAGWSIHDACYWIPVTVIPSQGLGAALLRWRRDVPDLGGRTSTLQMIGAWWGKLSENDRKMSFSDLCKFIKSKTYIGARHDEFAAECAKWGVDKDSYLSLEKLWLNAINRPSHLTIPRIEIVAGDYTAKILDNEDPRALWAGSHAACCQHPGGDGESCAWHGVSSVDGAILVVEKNGKIVAQSWLWRRENVVVCDNIEATTGSHRKDLPIVYEAISEKLIGTLGISEVRVGINNSDCDLKNWAICSPIKAPSGIYTDAQKQRKIR